MADPLDPRQSIEGQRPAYEDLIREYREKREAVLQSLKDRRRDASDEEVSTVEKVLKFGAQMAVVGLIGRRAITTDFAIQATHVLGRGAKFVGAPLRKGVRALIEAASGHASPAAYKQFELFEDLAVQRRLVQQIESDTGKRISGNTAHQAEIAKMVRDSLRERGYNQAYRQTATGSYRVATVGDIMNDANLQAQIGQSKFTVLQESVQKGWLDPSFVLHRGRATAYLKNLPGGSQGFHDMRMFSPRFVGHSAYNLLSNVKVPLVGLRPVDLIASVVRPFTEGAAGGRVGAGIKTGKGISTPHDQVSFILGKSLYTFDPTRRQGLGGFTKLAEGMKAVKMGGVGRARLERHGNAVFPGEIAMRDRINRGQGSFLDKMMNLVGVGRPYRTRDSVLETAVIHPLRRRFATQAGQAQVVAHDFVARADTLGHGKGVVRKGTAFVQKLQAASGALPGQGAYPVEEFLSAAVPNDVGASTMGWWERVKAHLGISRKASVARPGSRPLTERVLHPRHTPPAADMGGRRSLTPDELARPGPAGISPGEAPSRALEYYATSSGIRGLADNAVDLLHYGTNRLNDLIGMTFGIGFKPTVGEGVRGGLAAFAGNLGKIYGIHQAGVLGLEALNYADYMVETATGGLVSPKKAAIRLYQGMSLAQSYLQSVFISPAARYAEGLMPGSMETGFGFGLRTIAPPVAGVALGGKRGLLAGLATSFLIGGTGITDTPEDRMQEFSGEKLVAVRKSRWWMLGRQPFEGGQIDYFRPHWTKMALSDYQYTDSLYGSKAEYFGNVSRLPNLHNFFGLKTLFQDGGITAGGDTYLAQKHRYTRPYPDTPGVDHEAAAEDAAAASLRGPENAPYGTAERLGAESIALYGKRLKSPHGLDSTVDRLTELGGIYKWMLWDLTQAGDKSPRLASYSTIGSDARAFYDRGLGGMAGLTEFTRRFVLSSDAKQGINTVPNQMPEWLPGARSEFEEDRNRPNRFDYTLGDPYARIPEGEARLPGPGYEALHRLHSKQPGVYDAVDRFMILADVAPQSEAFKHYEAIVNSWASTGVIDTSWEGKIANAKEGVKKKLERYQFYHRRFTGEITDPDPEGTANRYNFLEKAVGGAWEVFSHDIVPRAGDMVPFGSMVTDKLLPTLSPIEHYLRHQVYGEEFADWNNPWGAFAETRFNTLKAGDPITATAGGAIFGMALGANPVASLLGGALLGGVTGTSSAARWASTGHMTGGYVPEHRQRDRELQEWFDNFAFVKSRALEEQAIQVGDAGLAEYYKEQRKETMAGIDYSQNAFKVTSGALKAMDRNNRAYFTHFLNMPKEAQDTVMPYLPGMIQPAFAKGAGMLDQDRTNWAATKLSPDARAALYFKKAGGMPEADWAGWHPDVSMDTLKVRFIEDGTNSVSGDLHHFDLFNEHRHRAAPFSQIPIPVGDLDHVRLMGGEDIEMLKSMPRGAQVRMGSAGLQWKLRYDGQRDYRRGTDRVFGR